VPASADQKRRSAVLQAQLVTRGKGGAEWISNATGARASVAALKVKPVNTTRAGDTFAGYFAPALDAGQTPAQARALAADAAALKGTLPGPAVEITLRPD